MDTLKQVIEALYAVSGPLAVLAYLPQIAALLKDKQGASGVSLSTWLMWVIALTINTVYAGYVNGDRYFFISSASSLAGTVMVFGIASYKRWQLKAIID